MYYNYHTYIPYHGFGSHFVKFFAKDARGISEKSLEQKSVIKRRSKFSCEVVLEFQKQNYHVEGDASLNCRDKSSGGGGGR